VHTIAYFCADCAGKGKVQNKPLQLCDEENAANEGEGHGTIKVSLLIEYYSSPVCCTLFIIMFFFFPDKNRTDSFFVCSEKRIRLPVNLRISATHSGTYEWAL
jgi:hypothetical protein